MFAEWGEKEKNEELAVHTPKGRKFQEKIGFIFSERTAASEVRKIEVAESLFCLFDLFGKTEAIEVQKVRMAESLFDLFSVLVSK